jgi:hypothetical protein
MIEVAIAIAGTLALIALGARPRLAPRPARIERKR